MDLKIDVKEMVTKAVDKITKDEAMQKQFKQDPVKTVEKVLNVDLPDDMMQKVVDGVKGKISLDKLGGALDGLKKLF